MKIGLFLATLVMAASAQDATLDQVDEGVVEDEEYSRPPVEENTVLEAGNNECNTVVHEFNPYMHKKVYTVGLQAIRGFDSAVREYQAMFQDYLTATVGRRFDPPINFQVVPMLLDGIYNAIESEELDFLFANPGVYTCIGTEHAASSIATAVMHLTVRTRTFDLDVFGGVITALADREDINTLEDLKDKVIGAGSTSMINAGQMQIYEMMKAGLSYVNDPAQVVFTYNQNDVVAGLLDGTFDVGFVRTNQLEFTKDADGKPIDVDLFKVINPNVNVLDNGLLFPFLHSTDIIPEWTTVAMDSVSKDVTLEVQEALINFERHFKLGKALQECREKFGAADCEARDPSTLHPDAPCDASVELADLAVVAGENGSFAGWRPPMSYWTVRTMLQNAGFMVQDEKNEWYCTRPADLYDGIDCPAGYFKRDIEEFLGGCKQVGLDQKCEEHPEWDCFCRPCVKANDVDIYQFVEGDDDLHLVEYYGEELPGCKKMEICGTIQQGQSVTLRIFDNELRDEVNVRVTKHAGDVSVDLPIHRIPDTYAYEVQISEVDVGVQVVEVFFDGLAVAQSPVRVMVDPVDCDGIYGEGAKRVANEVGECVCDNNTYMVGSTCMESGFFFFIIFAAVFAILGVLVFIFLSYKKKQSDTVWHIAVDELHFNEPPEVIGQGGFGVVVLGQYRGTKVAVKRVLPPTLRRKKGGSIRNSGSIQAIGKAAAGSTQVKSKGKTVGKDKEDKSKQNVSFNNSDIENQKNSGTHSLSMGRSNNSTDCEWEEFLRQDSKYDNALKILESATLSNHGSGEYEYQESRSIALMNYLPMWMRFDEKSILRREFVNEMRLLSRLRHPCITTVMGAVVASNTDPMLVMEFMEYGSLYDILRNETMYAGGEIILQVIRDITQGIQFLHASKPPILHGDLKAKNILVDSRFRAKVADFGFSTLKGAKSKNVLQGTPFFMAPEYLRRSSEYTTQCDIYSLGMIFYEIYARADPFEGEDPRVVLPKICHPRVNKRPPMPLATPPKISDIIKKCWSANPFFRPTAKDIDYILVEMSAKEAEPLEHVDNKFKEGMQRKPTSLYELFPKHIADALNSGKRVEPEAHEIVSVVFSDIIGFDQIIEDMPPLKVSQMLDRLYLVFDQLAKKHKVFKVETIGDAYMGVTNIDGSQFDEHAKNVAEFGLACIDAANDVWIDEDDKSLGTIQIRVGFHSGPVVSNVIGSLNPRFGLFGDTVNTASRMESNSVAGRVHCSAVSAQLLATQAPDLPCAVRGKIKVKGKGVMLTYWVNKPDDGSCPASNMVEDDEQEEDESDAPVKSVEHENRVDTTDMDSEGCSATVDTLHSRKDEQDLSDKMPEQDQPDKMPEV